MTKRSKVELYEQIRKSHERDELSIRALARNASGCTGAPCAQALDSAIPPPRKQPERPAPGLGPWKPIIDGWLAADREAPKKQRHTARRVWQRLVDEHDAEVAESTVRALRRGGQEAPADRPCRGDGSPDTTRSATRPRSTSARSASTSAVC